MPHIKLYHEVYGNFYPDLKVYHMDRDTKCGLCKKPIKALSIAIKKPTNEYGVVTKNCPTKPCCRECGNFVVMNHRDEIIKRCDEHKHIYQSVEQYSFSLAKAFGRTGISTIAS